VRGIALNVVSRQRESCADGEMVSGASFAPEDDVGGKDVARHSGQVRDFSSDEFSERRTQREVMRRNMDRWICHS
jgi:hypothetical protein